MSTVAPDRAISLEDFIERAKEEGCIVVENNKGVFIGEPGTTTGLSYPHIHVWLDGNIALSVAAGRNTKVGKDESILVDELCFASMRFALGAGHLANTIRWVLASA